MAAIKTLSTLHLSGSVSAEYRSSCFHAYGIESSDLLLVAFTKPTFAEDLARLPDEHRFKVGLDVRAYLKESLYQGMPGFFDRVVIVRRTSIEALERLFGGLSRMSG